MQIIERRGAPRKRIIEVIKQEKYQLFKVHGSFGKEVIVFLGEGAKHKELALKIDLEAPAWLSTKLVMFDDKIYLVFSREVGVPIWISGHRPLLEEKEIKELLEYVKIFKECREMGVAELRFSRKIVDSLVKIHIEEGEFSLAGRIAKSGASENVVDRLVKICTEKNYIFKKSKQLGVMAVMVGGRKLKPEEIQKSRRVLKNSV